MKININKRNIKLLLENKEIEKLQLQNFINNNMTGNERAEELQRTAAMNAGVTPPDMKNAVIQANHKNKVIHANYADLNQSGKIDAEDLKKHALVSKAF